VTQITV